MYNLDRVYSNQRALATKRKHKENCKHVNSHHSLTRLMFDVINNGKLCHLLVLMNDDSLNYYEITKLKTIVN